MYSMSWVTYSFMRVRHVSNQGTLRGWGLGQFVATAHVMQWCRLNPPVFPLFPIFCPRVGDPREGRGDDTRVCFCHF